MKKIMVIGATSAIAQETANIWAAQGHSMFLVGRRKEKLEGMSFDLPKRGANRVTYHVADLDVLEKHQEIVSEAIRTLGGLDIALIAHGTLPNQKACELDQANALGALHTNYMSAVSLVLLLARHMENERRGCLAVITSVAGERGKQSNYVYGSSKGGIDIFLQGVRQRLHKLGVHVLSIKPGWVDTPMTAHMKKTFMFKQPQDIARGIVRSIDKGRDIVYLPWFWKWILMIIKLIPEGIYKRLRL